MRLGIGVDRWVMLKVTDDDFKRWANDTLPAFTRTREIRALDESLTRWESVNYVQDRRVARATIIGDDLLVYRKYATTPPARPEWLEALG